ANPAAVCALLKSSRHISHCLYSSSVSPGGTESCDAPGTPGTPDTLDGCKQRYRRESATFCSKVARKGGRSTRSCSRHSEKWRRRGVLAKSPTGLGVCEPAAQTCGMHGA